MKTDILLLLASLAVAQNTVVQGETGNTEIYNGLILGVGPGTFAVILAALVGVIICFFKDCVATPNLCVAGAISVPCIVLIIVRSMPVKSVASDTEATDKLPTDYYIVRTVTVTILIFVAAIILCLTMFCSNFTATLVAKKMDS
jgi:hypothetical protein